MPYEFKLGVWQDASCFSRFAKREIPELHDMPHQSQRLAYKSVVAALAFLFSPAAATAQEQQAQVASPVQERRLTGSLVAGNRWRAFTGNEEVYRSMVNLGEGPKLIDLFTSYRTPEGGERRFGVDRASLRATTWGGEPGSTLLFNAGRTDTFELTFGYRKADYFSALPSFANPTAARAGASQSTYDISRRLLDARFTYLPGRPASPFVAFERDSNDGPGRTTFVQDANEYAVATDIDNQTTTVRGGVELRYERWNAIFEGGGSVFHDDQSMSATGPNLGNRETLFLGRRLQLDSLEQRYDVSGRDRFIRAVAEARPFDKLVLNGRFSFSQPTTKADYSRDTTGSFVVLSTLQTFTNESVLTRSESTWPHPSASIGAEFAPVERVRIIETLTTDRFHVTGDTDPAGVRRFLAANFTRNRIDAFVEINEFIGVHGGHGFLWADARNPGSDFAPQEKRELQRNEGFAGIALRWPQNLRVNVDLEAQDGDEVFFRTDRRSRKRALLRARYDVAEGLVLGVSTSHWNNDNRAADTHFRERSHEYSADITYAPGSGQRLSVNASYSRGTYRSDLPFIVPQNFQQERSLYRDRGHTASISAAVRPLTRTEVRLGGSLFVSTASPAAEAATRPTRFYNPYARVSFQLQDRVSWLADWAWHSYSHRAFRAEDFRAHLFTTGIEYRF